MGSVSKTIHSAAVIRQSPNCLWPDSLARLLPRGTHVFHCLFYVVRLSFKRSVMLCFQNCAYFIENKLPRFYALWNNLIAFLAARRKFLKRNRRFTLNMVSGDRHDFSVSITNIETLSISKHYGIDTRSSRRWLWRMRTSEIWRLVFW